MNERPPAPSEERIRAALARSPVARRRGEPGAAERLCEETAARLFDHLDPVRFEPRWAVDLAMQCGVRDRLAERFPGAQVLSCGYLPGALVRASSQPSGRHHGVAASPMRLPLAAASTDLLASNLSLIWFPDVGPVLEEMSRVLRPGGLVAFTTLGPGTLGELRQSWKAVDDRTHIIDFMDMHEIGDAMVKAGFADVVMDAERLTVTWPDARALLHDLRGLGTGNPLPARPPGLTTPRWLAAVVQAYEAHRTDGRASATVELVHGHGWKPQARAEVRLEAFARTR